MRAYNRPSSRFFFTAPAPTAIYTLSLHDALPIYRRRAATGAETTLERSAATDALHPLRRFVRRSEEHTSELQSRGHLVCRLLLEKKKNKNVNHTTHEHNTIVP